MRLQLAIALLLAAVATARADAVISARGAYYKERSTLVVQPMVDGTFDAGTKGRVDAHFLVDSITSASSATGSMDNESFTERRYEAGFGYSHLVLGWLRVGGLGRYSIESDYTSTYVAGRAELELNEKNTTLVVTAGRGFDSITNGIAVMSGAIGTPRKEESLRTGLTSVSLSQLLSPTLVANVTYDFMDAHGYQANLYRRVLGAGTPAEERVPRLRLRHGIFGGLRLFVPQTITTAVVGYRFYFDDWGIVSHTPEARVIQEIVEGLELRGRFRYYRQNAAEFYQDTYTADQIADPDTYISDDDKLSEHHTITAGGQLSVALSLFGVAGSWGDARIDVVVERILQTTEFGDAWNAHVGFSAPVIY